MNGVYLGIGGNKGNRAQLLAKAQRLIASHIGRITSQSSLYETAAWGNTKQANFLNQVLKVETKLNAPQCMQACLDIEKELGRTRNQKWESRTMDLDILFFNNEIIKTKSLIVPHPHLHERNFVLAPLCEIAPHFLHPVLRKKIFTLYRNATDQLEVKIYDPK
jgi:2-amino-4-hydroxy-6-hydroxymethyldihydropteridine diphosphokinase